MNIRGSKATGELKRWNKNIMQLLHMTPNY